MKYGEQKEKEKRKYLKKKEKGIIKSIDMTPREQRKTRKIWKEKSRKRRAHLALQDISNAPITPPNSDNEAPLQQQRPDGRAIAARRRSEHNRKLKYKIIKKQKLKIEKLNATVARYKKRLQRVKKANSNTKVESE